MREMLAPTSAIIGKGLGESVGFITDGRFSRRPGHGGGPRPRRSLRRRPIALIKNGDSITIDARKRAIAINVSAAELARRRNAWKQRACATHRRCADEIRQAGQQRGQGAPSPTPELAFRASCQLGRCARRRP